MIPKCRGCEEEYGFACELVRDGFHIATMNGREFIGKKHLCIIIVNDDGKLMAW